MCMGEFFDLGHGVPTWRPLRPRISKNPKPKNFDQKRDENGLAMGNGPRNLRLFGDIIILFRYDLFGSNI